MKYLGGKSKIAKHIVTILQNSIDVNNIETYIEPFVGGCNIIEYIKCKNRYGYDLNEYLIALLNHVKNGGELVDSVSRELYNDVRASYRAKSAKYSDYFYGMIGFLASYNGRFFDGGYAQDKGNRHYYLESKANLLKQVDRIKDVVFECCDYSTLNPSGAVIYCDPPYKGTKGYITGEFNYDEFWDLMREWSKENIVYISEELAPDDFDCVWSREVSRSVNACNKTKSTEKLFRYNQF